MDEFKGFNLSNLQREEQAEVKEYKSELGHFNKNQEKLIKFWRSTMFLGLTVLLIISFLLSLYNLITILTADFSTLTGAYTIQPFWLKILSVVGIIISLLIPLGILMITIGSWKLNKDSILFGLSLIKLHIGSLYIITVSFVILFIMIFLRSLYGEFIVVFTALAITIGVFYFIFKFLKNAIGFLDDTSSIIEKPFNLNQKDKLPEASDLVNYFIVILIVNVFRKIFSFFDSAELNFNNSQNEELYEFINSIRNLSSINLYLTIFILGFVIYMSNKFDEHMVKNIYVRTTSN